MPDLDDHLQTLLRGTAAVYSEDELKRKLAKSDKTGKPLRVKLGLDPSSPDIHIGHAVVLRLMRRFQDLGHKAVLIIGDYTARIGDPTGKSKTRPMLTPEEINANAETYLSQATKILDDSPERLELRRNSEWLGSMSFADVIRLASQMTVAQMLERDTFEKRYKAGQPISVHEFLYPLMQGWDSVCVEADVELGGTDQTFNNLVGRDLQSAADQEPQVVVVCPILRGLDGTEKMSKSLGNYIGVTDSPDDMFGKTMSIPDALMEEWFTLCTDLPASEIKTLCDSARTHPRDAKDKLGRAIVKAYYDERAADAASQEFRSRFAEGNLPADLESKVVDDSPIGIVALVRAVEFASSNSEARRLIQQGAVSIDDEKVTDMNAEIDLQDGRVLKVGKRRICRVEPKG
ncbi:MAG: tyrosine--tRNA ligase [Phycisphaerales bacterium]